MGDSSSSGPFSPHDHHDPEDFDISFLSLDHEPLHSTEPPNNPPYEPRPAAQRLGPHLTALHALLQTFDSAFRSRLAALRAEMASLPESEERAEACGRAVEGLLERGREVVRVGEEGLGALGREFGGVVERGRERSVSFSPSPVPSSEVLEDDGEDDEGVGCGEEEHERGSPTRNVLVDWDRFHQENCREDGERAGCKSCGKWRVGFERVRAAEGSVVAVQGEEGREDWD